MRRLGLAVLLLSFSATISASELYIIPAYAKDGVQNGVTSWRSELLLTNPHQHAVELELESTLGETEPNGCRFPEFSLGFPSQLAPRETRLVCMPFATAGAFAFRASDTLVVTSELIANRPGVFTRQTIEPGRRWIEAHEDAAIMNVRIGDGARANLILVNPGDEAITVSYHVIRTGSTPGNNHEYEPVEGSVDVPARSVSLTSLPEGPRHDCGHLVPCSNAIEHEVVLESTGRFYAATSSVEDDDATFRSPVILE